jgi:putative acetyltransferase
MPNIRNATNKDQAAVTKLIYGILEDYKLKHDPSSTDADLMDIEKNYTARNGLFDLLEDENGKIIATVGLYKIDDETCELRKMYLDKNQRGKGLGKFLLEHALKRACELGYKKVVLETASVLKEAINLYERYGFKQFYPEHFSGRCDKAYLLELKKEN